MNINNELLEKYHLNTCTSEERKQVEEWLFNANVDEWDTTGFTGDKEVLKNEMWQEIVVDIPPFAKPLPTRTKLYFMWKGAIAATLLIVMLAGLSYFCFKQTNVQPEASISLINTSSHQVKHVDEQGYSASVGPNTAAKINSEDGAIDLKGSILISPKRDITIAQGLHQSTVLKKGQTYVILKNSIGKSGVIVISEKNLLDISPVMQQQINTQFGI